MKMGLLEWIIGNIITVFEIPISILVRSLDYKTGWNSDWECEVVSFPMRYFTAIQFLLFVVILLGIFLLGIFLGYRVHKWRTNTD